jgi:hypothetical protein
MKLNVSLFALTGLFAAACGGPTAPIGGGNDTLEAWKPHDAPINLDSSYNRSIDQLPLSAALINVPWVDSYWPSYQGGISARWITTEPQHFTYTSPTREELQAMDYDSKARLSPAEKFDILRGDYSYGLVRSERQRTSPTNESWEGICHGWAPAALLFQEPQPIVITNADGIEIPFGSADTKALLSYYQGQIGGSRTKFLGLRCNVKIDDFTDPRAHEDDCKGVNAGAFHVIIANQIGLRGEGFIADVTRDFQVWNHPIFAFDSVLQTKADISPTAAPGTVRELNVVTVMKYLTESAPQWSKLDPAEYTIPKTYRYTLEIDASGNIVGGEWLQDDRPDFLWKQDRPQFRRGFEALDELYLKSIGK